MGRLSFIRRARDSWVSYDQVRALLDISGVARIAREKLLDVSVSWPTFALGKELRLLPISAMAGSLPISVSSKHQSRHCQPETAAVCRSLVKCCGLPYGSEYGQSATAPLEW
ncbi:MAG: hypothetical protein DI537_49660 [Stutzerimonas stutzeri]|nr:MAG: hypothetical protein DI537_49660 [Stutzerimonas stutzeri]